jgi:signal peptidase I
MQPTNSFTDQLANISPLFIVCIVFLLIAVRAGLAKNKAPWARMVSEACDTANFVLILAFLLMRPFVAQAFFIPSGSMERTLLVNDRLIVDKFSYRMKEPQRNDVVVFEAPLVATRGKPNVDFIKRLIGKPGDTIRVKKAEIIVDGEPVDAFSLGAPNVRAYLRERMGLDRDTPVKLFPEYVLVDGKRKVSQQELAQVIGRPGAKIEIVPGRVYRNGKLLNEPFTNEDPDYDYPENSDQPLKLGANELFMMGDNRNNSEDSHVWGPLESKRVVGHAVVLFWPPNRIGRIR